MTCVIVGNYNIFYKRDHEWTEKILQKILESKDEKRFAPVWEGFVYFSKIDLIINL